ncbi:MAG TPA: lytic transglycosylase domain-containing protein [Devosiaceae bacterium]|nr:lytic transglycosylase domain-containing protein [Devosiaceae bacterium]
MPVDPVSVSPNLRYALARAGDRNGVDFGYLLQTAMRESSLDPAARAATSSAVGLFQFVESTWLEVIKERGPALGYGILAQKVSRDADGGYSVADPRARADILKLREDPQMAADLAAAFTRTNGEYLGARFGRMPSPGELYIAHFLGARGAETFFAIGLQAPDSPAAQHFPRQAAANPSIFYDNGRPRSIRQVYRVLVSHHGDGPPAPASAQLAVQQIAGSRSPAMVEAMLPNPAMSFVSRYRQSAPAPLVPATGTATSPALDQRPTEEDFASFFNRMDAP